MQIQIKNIGKIKNAIINLDGLSVIAGNNDTGKSTVNKIVFSVIKAFQKHKEFSKISKESIIKEKIERLYITTRLVYDSLKEKDYKDFAEKIYIKLQKEYEPKKFWEDFINSVDKIKFLELKKEFIKKFNIDSYFMDHFINLIEEIKEEFFKEETKEYLVEKALDHIFESEFKGKLNCGNKKGEIYLYDGDLFLFKITIKNNKATVKIKDEFFNIKDSTFINSPIILDFFNNSKFCILQYHYEDLFNKINNIGSNILDEKNGFLKKIEKIIEGNFELKDNFVGKKLVFTKNGIENGIEIINTAIGIKSFGILNLLDKANCLDGDDLLILDEPEVHLHPEWQVKYANLITELIKERQISVLITSHSPYMIEALSKYSKELKINASFYLSEENGKGKCVIEDKTKDQNYILDKLVEPFEKLVWN